MTHEGIGDSLLIRRHYQEALEEYRKAPGDSSDVWDKMGIAYQMLSDTKDAIRYLRQAVDEGFISAKELARDDNFDSLHGNPEFQRLIGGHGK